MPSEPRIPGLKRILRLPGGRIERDVDDEIAFNIESRVRDLLAQGRSPDEARRMAEEGSPAPDRRRESKAHASSRTRTWRPSLAQGPRARNDVGTIWNVGGRATGGGSGPLDPAYPQRLQRATTRNDGGSARTGRLKVRCSAN